MARLDYDKLNSTLRYAMWSVFQVRPGVLGDDRAAAIEDAKAFFARFDDTDVIVRGIYDVAGTRADADFMIWTHAEHIEDLQKLYADFRRTTILGRASTPVWSNTALHRPAEFNKSHLPAFIAGEEPATTSACTPSCGPTSGTCCPTSSAARCSPTTAWRPAATPTSAPTPFRPRARRLRVDPRLRAPELHRIVDLMRDLRATDARLHVREETPFFTGPRVDVEALVASLP